MVGIKDILIMSLAGLVTILSVGKVYTWTKYWVSGLVSTDYGDLWVPVALFLWFIMLLLLIFSGSAYVLKKAEVILNGRLARFIRMN